MRLEERDGGYTAHGDEPDQWIYAEATVRLEDVR